MILAWEYFGKFADSLLHLVSCTQHLNIWSACAAHPRPPGAEPPGPILTVIVKLFIDWGKTQWAGHILTPKKVMVMSLHLC